MVKTQGKKIMNYKLLDDAFSSQDIKEGIKVLKSKQITMSKETKNFEKNFAKRIGAKYAVMVNSGSSANLIALFASINPLQKNCLKKGDEVIIPAICWSTSLWPIVQAGLKPVFADVDIDTLNMSIKDLEKKINRKTKAIMCVHILGISTNMKKINQICKKKNLLLFEDTCESLGTTYDKKHLGTFGDYGMYSFYYSHQITSGEGGMVVCNNEKNYNILKTLRSHGWSRDTTLHKSIVKKYKNLNEKFLFINSGFNLRPTEIQAAIGNNQLKRLNKFIQIRNYNRQQIISTLKNDSKWNNQFDFIYPKKNINPSWFGLAILIKTQYRKKIKKFLNFINSKNIETRPILSGNFNNQPASKLYNISLKKNNFPISNLIQDTGFFLGIHTKKITSKELNYLSKNLLKIAEF